MALTKKAIRIGQLVDDRKTEKLGEDFMKIAQATVLCTLPYSELSERSVVRRARLGDGSTLTVTFTACVDGVSLPYGSDRRLMFWLFDRALEAGSPNIAWESAGQYLREMKLFDSGRNYRLLQESFLRLAGMHINIERFGAAGGVIGMNRSIFDDYHLPKSISCLADPRQMSLDGIERKPFGVRLSQRLFEDFASNHISLPRRIWSDMGGSAQVQDIVMWLCYRCHAARNESLIPWAALADQFSRDSNPRRQKAIAVEAVMILRRLWPSVGLEAVDKGLMVSKATSAMLPDDVGRGRISDLN